ncbi:hypothetical protein Tco_1548202 [Tanacetum coccineum]
MVDENVPAPAPTRFDYQILPFAAWVPIGKSNYNTNFFRAFTAYASVPAIYIQQFWNMFTYEAKTGVYSIELDETRFVLDANLLREALEITPIDQAHQFMSPPSGEAIMDFVNKLGYTEVIHFVSRMAVNNLSQPWRAILSMINQFPLRRAGKTSLTLFLIVGSQSSLSVIWEEPIIFTNDQHLCFILLKKISDLEISNSFPTKKTKKSSKPAPASKPKPVKEKPSKPSTTKPPKPKPAKEKSTNATPLQKADKGKVAKVRNVKSSFQLVDEPDEEPAQPKPEHQGEGKEYDMERAIQMILESWTPATEEASTGPSIQPQDDTSANIVRNSSSPADAESDKTNSRGDTEILQITNKLGEDVDEQAGPDPGISRLALARPYPKPMHDEFMANLYLEVQESLKFLADEHVILEDPLSLTGTLSSMKNLEDAYAIGDQFINDKSTDDEPGKLNVEAKVVSMVTVPISQASSSVPPLSTPIIDLSPPKPASSTTQAPIFTATTTTTTTTLPPPPQQQSTTESELVERVTALEKKFSDLEQNNKNLDNTTRNLGSRVYTLELRDLPHKIDEAVRENVKEAVQIALQAPLRDRFRDLSEEDMKEMLHQRMFESSTYKSLPEHIALYEALEASMARAQRDKFLAEKEKSRSN